WRGGWKQLDSQLMKSIGRYRMCLHANCFVFSLTLLIMASTGCEPTQKSLDASTPLHGTVDTALTPKLQSKQSALGRLLRAFQEGAHDPSDLQFMAGDIKFADGVDKFYGDSKRLYRWEFGASPKNDQVPVVLYFDGQAAGPVDPKTEKREARTYKVLSSGSGYTIQLVK
ncbi:MAG: hypothetical protein ACOVQM_05070, partial [Pirellula sp.]